MPAEDVISDLMRLGLHQNEAKVYRALVLLGQSWASRIAEVAAVPRSKVYEVLYSLEAKGIVRRLSGTEPAEFKPYDPKDAIPYLLEKVHNSGKSAQDALKVLAKEHQATEDEFVWTAIGEEQIRLGARSLISKATGEVFIATRTVEFLGALRPVLAEAKKRGIDIKLVAAGIPAAELSEFRHYASTVELEGVSSELLVEQLQIVLRDPAVQTLNWDFDQVSLVVVDNRESFAVFRASGESGRPWAIHIRNPLIVIFQRQVIISLMAALQRILSSQGD
jgi:HTH-type transcriptional regulator, sugar sensing transcriptional regulator